MPRYKYKAYDAAGALTKGEIAASTRSGALDALSRRSQFPVELIESGAGAELKWWQREVLGSGRLSTAGLAVFTRELASLVKASLPLDESLRIVAMQPLIPQRLRQITNGTLERVLEGASLSEALAAPAVAFPEFYCRLVKAGEASGSLGEVLEDLATFLERAAETRARVGSALLYPAVLVVAALGVLVVIATVLLPAIVPIFEDAGVTPPFLIRLLAQGESFFGQHWGLSLVLAAAFVAAVLAAMRSERLKLARDRLWLRIPILRELVQRRETARFSRTFAALIRNGVPVLDAIRIAGSVLTNRAFAEAVQKAADDVREGAALSLPLTKSGIFPDLFLRLTVVGEQTGQMEAMHVRVAEIYEAAFQRQLDRLTALITPVLTVVIGGFVGMVIISVMNAILSVNELAIK